ncbi:hypothetical protein F2Q68_00006752 [Brassica cretica]|uniref:RRM domain-containing protein n=2 Tax=Brassica cretica TaxID=69181 RepID=A0ABQ7CII3_BRACR|nr:hypothetical protein F2Q68_00006752 [Brassica cretica]KAF3551356.1 hypothetical protein DY000_02010341 [Brassica cretica]
MYGEFNMWEDAKGASRRMNERGVEKTSCSFIEVNGVYLRFMTACIVLEDMWITSMKLQEVFSMLPSSLRRSMTACIVLEDMWMKQLKSLSGS